MAGFAFGAPAPGASIPLRGDEARALAARLTRAKELREEIRRREKEAVLADFTAKRYDWQKKLQHGKNRILCLMAANQVGKSETAAAATAYHLTGLYPDDWKGNFFSEPIEAWVAGITAESTRDIIQMKLFGDWYAGEERSLGMIHPDYVIGEPTKRMGTPNAMETIRIRHVPTGGISLLTLKSMEQGRSKFQGTKKHWIWLDEDMEGDGGYDIFSEAKMRTINVPNGQILVTYTPLNGMNELAQFLINKAEDILMVNATWEDAPHLGEEVIAEFLANMKPHELEARSRGIPVIREGLIYPFPESDIVVKPFTIPNHWPIVLGKDLGWGSGTTVILLAKDPQTDIVYVAGEYHRKEVQRAEHAREITKRFGPGIYIAADPSGMRTESDGKKSIKEYRDLGLNIHIADNSVKPGIDTCFDLFASGKLKIFSTCTETIQERRFYQYKVSDSTGKIQPRKKKDHHMDTMRYGVMALKHARPAYYFKNQSLRSGARHGSPSWTPADPVAGY